MVTHDVRAGDEVLEGAAQLFRDPPAPLAELRDYWSFTWDGRVAWFEEALEVRVHARDPSTRVDVLPTSATCLPRTSAASCSSRRRP
jgi:hypothetical protein